MKYLGNTLILWILCFVPQIVVSLLLAVWFTDRRLKLKGQRFFKTVIYMPNLIMASAFGFLFLTILSPEGPIVNMLLDAGILQERFYILDSVWGTRATIGFMNFLMWFGNTTLLLMSGVMGIDEDVFEAATVDGAGAFRTFKDITMPLLRPIFVYVFITSLIGGIQLFDVAQMFTRNSGGPDMTSQTLIMQLNNTFRTSQNYGKAGAISIIIFIMTAILSVGVFFVSYRESLPKKHKKVA
jgi:multiple sugar transport system permease protein